MVWHFPFRFMNNFIKTETATFPMKAASYEDLINLSLRLFEGCLHLITPGVIHQSGYEIMAWRHAVMLNVGTVWLCEFLWFFAI